MNDCCDNACYHLQYYLKNRYYHRIWQEICCHCGNEQRKEDRIEQIGDSSVAKRPHGPYKPDNTMRTGGCSA